MSGEISQTAWLSLLLTSVLFGFFAALLYDVFRIRRIAINIPLLSHFEDFFFMLFCGVAYSIIFYANSSGKVRGFAFAGGILGLVLYRKTIGRLVISASEAIIRFIKKLIKKIVLPPVRFVKKLSCRFALKVKKLFVRLTLKAEKKHTEKYLKKFAESALFGFEKF